MPLVILSGYPASGKTTRAKELQSYLLAYLENSNLSEFLLKFRNVILINEESVGIDRNTVYESSNVEKNARALIISSVERLLTKEDIIICDYMNYIKGFRYQLYCIARSLGTPSCCIHCGITIDLAAKYNTSRLTSYPDLIFKDLITRYEEPDPKNRWDSPLFTTIPSDPSINEFPISNALNLQYSSSQSLDSRDIGAQVVAAILLKVPAKPNLSTVVKPLTESNYVHDLDVVLSEIVSSILIAQKSLESGGGNRDIVVPRSKLKVRLPIRNITMAELRRMKKQYGGINKLHTVTDLEKVADLFVEYLNRTL
ncbi:kti12, chromatin associated [Nowakowskiella sp. JEL0078]|nr:kti12, chromatin associated [Nowakowskiella sp. JEL0078]